MWHFFPSQSWCRKGEKSMVGARVSALSPPSVPLKETEGEIFDALGTE